ncbi:hypothetical protein SXIM_23590 [Streptomyces xiamenensis]|uniref:Uncharacterized protein n=1 Tax=Streptomyces xiamenensis TaxID=408015 RepID=A0A0F7FTV6_9ACTN|nr:hypothetical protein SXIM_23590 [Streptomyces xiamenensis]
MAVHLPFHTRPFPLDPNGPRPGALGGNSTDTGRGPGRTVGSGPGPYSISAVILAL